MERKSQSSINISFGKKQNNMGSIDRLSGLPDGVIWHILSFLPTKLSVSTCILAKRWRFLWAHVPTLDFDIRDHRSGMSFMQIIMRVMLRHKVQSINAFRLCCDGGYDCSEYDSETWISTALERNVQNLDIYLGYQLMLPGCIFTCKTLVDLTLKYCIGIPSIDAVVSLPSLKKLHLYSVRYEVDESLPHLLSGCPVLEELIIKGTMVPSLNYCDISSPTIKRLTVNFPFDGSEFDYKVKINAPALRCLNVHDCSYEHILFSPTTSSLIEAHIRFDHNTSTVDKYFLKLLDSLCNVKCLELSGYYDKDLDLVTSSIVKFDNLTRLEFATNWCFLTKFLESADHLQVLVIHEVMDSDLKVWMEPNQVPKCLLSHLRTITINQFGCTEQEFELLRYLLRNTKLLERMEIYSFQHETDFKAKFDAFNRISSFQRGSEACKLVFH